MDSRILVEPLLGLKKGDGEIIRNGGGRVNQDVIRSMIICQDILGCDTAVAMHHTDCGGQHAVFHPASLSEHAKYLAFEKLGLAWTDEATKEAQKQGIINMQPIYPGQLDQSVRDDVAALRAHPNIKPTTNVYGLVLDTATGKLRQVVT